LPKFALQLLSAQVPVVQVAEALERAHATLHAPQCVSVLRLCSHVIMSLSQSPKPAVHDVSTHAPPTQLSPPAVLQVVPHAPQLVLLLS